MTLKKLLCLLTFCISLHAQETTPVVILGGGIAGMTAALQVSQAGQHPIVVVGPTPGGIITVSHEVQNWPGEINITGSALADKIEKQIQERGVELMTGVVTSVDFSSRPFKIRVTNPILETTSELYAESCIITLGSLPNLLQVPGEDQLLYQKIFTCAPCDGLQFKDKEVAVIGGGDSALVESLYLANIAKKVTILVRGNKFKSVFPERLEILKSKPNVQILYQTSVQEFKESKNGIELILPQQKLLVQGAFLAIGSTPNTSLFKNSLQLDGDGYIVLQNGQSTSIPGVFAAGDVADPLFKQAVSAAGDATKAALGAISFVSSSSSTPNTPKQATSVKELSDLKELQSILATSKLPVIAYFFSNNCPPCRSFKPLYQKWSEEYSDQAKFLKINVQECEPCAAAYKVQGIPTVIIFANGKEIKRATGTTEMVEIIKFLESLKPI